MKKLSILLLFGYVLVFSVKSQEYILVWEDNFDGTSLDSSIWNIEHKEGVWNTGGNQELQYYRKENVFVGDDGNGNNCLIVTAKSEAYNGYKFTSGRVNTKSKFSFKNGKLEARIKIPDLANGLWPAFWTLGYENINWPDCGEIDIMEMGHAQAIAGGIQNKFVGAHLHWGPYPSDYGKEYTAPLDLHDDYHLYQLEWTESQIKVSLDNYLFFSMDVDGSTTEEFRDYSHYILINLAVGGSLTQVLNPNNVTAPLPAKMYIDYVRIYQKDGVGRLNNSGDTLFGNFGVFEETANVAAGLDIGYDADTLTSGLVQRTGDIPKEGQELLSYHVNANTDFDFRIQSLVNRNMINYTNGSIQFWLQTESSDTLWIGISDTLGNESFIPVYEGTSNNPLRDGEWQLVWVQMADLASGVNFNAMNDFLIIKGIFESPGYLLIDRIVWFEKEYVELVDDYYGIFAEHEDITKSLDFEDGGHIFVWSGFTANSSESSYYGTDVLAYNANLETWNGFGIHSDNAIDLSSFFDGALHFHYKTSGNEDVTIGIKNSEDKAWSHLFSSNTELDRDGQWHTYAIPLINLKPDSGDLTENDLKDITILFYMVGTLDIAFDEIYYSKTGNELLYPLVPAVKDITSNNQIIFPNPARDFIQIENLSGELSVHIYDYTGRMVLSQNIYNTEKVHISNLHSGYYLIQIDNKNFSDIYKFIVE